MIARRHIDRQAAAEAQRKYYAKNRAKCLAKSRKWELANRPKVIEKNRTYRQNNRENDG